MSDPSTELQRAIYAALKADAGVMALAYQVYDDTRLTDEQKADGAPWGDVLGYVSFGPEQIFDDSADCVVADSVFVQLDVWSKAVGRLHCKALCEAVDAVVGGLDLAENALRTIERTQYKVFPDVNDGIMHGVLKYRADIERA